MAAFTIDPLRPALGVLRYLFSSLFSDIPLLWHGALLLVKCGIAFFIGLLVWLMSGLQSEVAKLSSYAAGLCWLLFPWNAAADYWPTFSPIILLICLYGGMILLLVEGWRKGQTHALTAAAIYLCCCLSYEAFYLQFIPIAFLGMILTRAKRATGRDVTVSISALFIAQLIAGAWFIVSRRFGYYTVKNVQPDWIARDIRVLQHLPVALVASFGEVRSVFAASAMALVLALGLAYWTCLTNPSKRASGITSLQLMLTALFAGVISAEVFALGGPSVAAFGVETRSLVLFSFWLAVAGGAVLSYVLENLPSSKIKRFLSVAIALIATCLIIGQLLRGTEWATAWRLQQRILAEAPVSEMRASEPDGRILLVSPIDVKGAPVFAAPWDINHAMPLTYPFLAGRKFVVYSPWGGPMVGDDKTLAYLGQPILERGTAVYVWKPLDRTFQKMTSRFVVKQDLSINVQE